MSSAVVVAQPPLVELAVLVAGELVDEVDAARALEAGEVLAAEREQLVGERGAVDAGLRLDDREHRLAPLVVGDADGADVGDRRDG